MKRKVATGDAWAEGHDPIDRLMEESMFKSKGKEEQALKEAIPIQAKDDDLYHDSSSERSI